MLYLGPRQPDHLAGAGQRAARAPAGDEVVEPPAGEVGQDLRAGGTAVIGRIGRVLELARQEPAVLRAPARSALRTMPVPRSAAGVRITRAPNMRMILRRSTEKLSAMTATNG